jgi:hypothetical protein
MILTKTLRGTGVKDEIYKSRNKNYIHPNTKDYNGSFPRKPLSYLRKHPDTPATLATPLESVAYDAGVGAGVASRARAVPVTTHR